MELTAMSTNESHSEFETESIDFDLEIEEIDWFEGSSAVESNVST